jgi:hypothetical protein
MTEPAPSAPAPVTRCPNCGAAVTERFCARCGQERKTLRVAFHRLAGEAIAESLSLDSKLARTLGTLVFRPGVATRTYLAGRRASQTSPVKLYLLLSFLYFFAGALGPSAVQFAVGANEDGQEGAPLVMSDEELRDLRESGGVGARLADRFERVVRLPPDEARERLKAQFAEKAPVAMFFLVPVLALLLRLFYRRSGLYFAEHAVLALHVHAVAFLFLVPGAVSGSSVASNVGWLASGLHGVAAMHGVYGRRWLATLARAALVGLLYAISLGLALLGALMAALLTL